VRTTRVFDLASRLATAAGARVHIRRRADGGYRVEAALPGGLSEQAHRDVLAALADADRYGHQYTAAAHRVWAELDEEPST